ncbi:MAG: MAPEG family protein [Candidatus Electrothrix sp. GW3-4]|uniref:MAPEG family protein n=1 Tax=Candidatus Electrothrix sp. GW3-4 TaxID=3126740 RepID=UPI0030D401D4
MDEAEIRQGKKRGWRNFLGGFGAPLIFGIPSALLIHSLNTGAYYNNRVSTFAQLDWQWVLLTAFVFSRLSAFLNLFPMVEKEKAMRSDAGDLRANMKIYKIVEDGPRKAVVMNMDGLVGRYNRANRSMENFVENAAPIGINAVLLSLFFPVPVFLLLCVYAGARILHQVQYINAGYSSYWRGIAYMLGVAVTGTLEGLLLVTAFSV